MGKASRTKVDATRREKIAAQRAAERRAEQRRRILIASGSIVVVIAVVVAFIVIKANNKPATNSSNGPTGAALASVVSKVTNVPASTLDKIGDGGGAFSGKIQSVNGGTPLTSGGKPEVLYMGAEYCPYCAAERWSMIVALSRFGTFSGLSTIHSSTTDTPANIPTWTFHGSSYTSKYLTFTPVEMQTNVRDPSAGQYPVLEKPTAAQQALITKYDAPPYVASANAGAISHTRRTWCSAAASPCTGGKGRSPATGGRCAASASITRTASRSTHTPAWSPTGFCAGAERGAAGPWGLGREAMDRPGCPSGRAVSSSSGMRRG